MGRECRYLQVQMDFPDKPEMCPLVRGAEKPDCLACLLDRAKSGPHWILSISFKSRNKAKSRK